MHNEATRCGYSAASTWAIIPPSKRPVREPAEFVNDRADAPRPLPCPPGYKAPAFASQAGRATSAATMAVSVVPAFFLKGRRRGCHNGSPETPWTPGRGEVVRPQQELRADAHDEQQRRVRLIAPVLIGQRHLALFSHATTNRYLVHFKSLLPCLAVIIAAISLATAALYIRLHAETNHSRKAGRRLPTIISTAPQWGWYPKVMLRILR